MSFEFPLWIVISGFTSCFCSPLLCSLQCIGICSILIDLDVELVYYVTVVSMSQSFRWAESVYPMELLEIWCFESIWTSEHILGFDLHPSAHCYQCGKCSFGALADRVIRSGPGEGPGIWFQLPFLVTPDTNLKPPVLSYNRPQGTELYSKI